MTLTYPADLKYRDSHEYVRLEGEVATIGISAFALDQLGDVVFVELPEVGTVLEQGQSFGSVESVKAVGDLYAPVSGSVVEVNAAVVDAPEKIGEDPYGEGWLLKISLSNSSELAETLTAEAYKALVEGQ
ncbi:glycine cleavage system protein GcvH [Leptolyngbya sp. FACHB-261]|uniref:glycine cleavage system protein GcvH n=1 Tax=Leptolyngbya sp. FACHB-261 TaxID=2692806 RepID=UPI001689ACA7|nr:glycine cleavage system protein GcvH [Leptolyngbya sp. FACHB-261]MBD2102266.1 glycine cleavage system protein GcvH [Leptolyngbya sp. FACHB-261]